ncbi:hypothetical protein BYT27DRAFT_7225102 [Phlegmacium glaucopus]|nr:hypothetical protein BYT27DRAFT_7225102 [Phlegmacium glaucopus]
MDQDMSYPSPGVALNQGQDPIGSGGSEDEEDAYDQLIHPDPGCQDLDNNQDDELGLDQDQDLGDIVDDPSDMSDLDLEPQSSHLNLDELDELATLHSLKISMAFIKAIASASLDDEHSGLNSITLERIRNPPTSIPSITDNPGMCLGLDIFLAITNAAQGTYTSVCNAILRRYPEDEIPSYEQVKQYISDVTGVFSVGHDMCINSCLAFTGPYKHLDVCPECAEMRYNAITKKAHRELLKKYDGELPWLEDIMHGQAFNDAVNDGHIKHDDLVLMFSFDGAQLYANKASDWFIPGPNKPKYPDTFLFPSLHHLSALQKEGLCMWDAIQQKIITSEPFLCLATADGPGMAYLNGLVGHHGKNGCRLFCTLPGRHKQGGTHYYPALLKPNNYSVQGCDHPDVDVYQLPSSSVQDYEEKLKYVMGSRTETQYKRRRLETGISKPSIFLGLLPQHRFDIPGCFGSDIMHLASLNIPDLFINIWQGTFDCDGKDNKSTWDWAVLQGIVWEKHRKDVAACTPYLPGSFDRPPHNPAEKISSGYKAWEFLMYFYGLGPALLFNILPERYWAHFCKLIYAMWIMNQHHISTEDLKKAHAALLEFAYEFELLYYQRHPEQLHFVRQSIHALTHLGPEAWVMERTIGNLGEEIHQHSNPYANLSEWGLQQRQVNTLKAMIPELEEEKPKIPRGAQDIGEGHLDENELAAMRRANIMPEVGDYLAVCRWARLQLPNGQVARSLWKESLKPLTKIRMARNVKACTSIILKTDETFALISTYSPPHAEILQKSHNTYWSCTHDRVENMEIIPGKFCLSLQ